MSSTHFNKRTKSLRLIQCVPVGSVASWLLLYCSHHNSYHTYLFSFFLKHSALPKNGARGRLLVPSFMFQGKFLYLRQLKYQFQWVNIILELLKRTKAHAKMWTHIISNEIVLFEWGSVTCRLSGSRTKNNKKHVTPPKGNFFLANPGKIKEQTCMVANLIKELR